MILDGVLYTYVKHVCIYCIKFMIGTVCNGIKYIYKWTAIHIENIAIHLLYVYWQMEVLFLIFDYPTC